MPGKHQTVWPCSVQRVQFPGYPYPSTCWIVQRLTSKLGQFPLAHSLRPFLSDVLPLLPDQARPSAGETALGPRLGVPCRTSFWSDLERFVWMSRPARVVHQRAFVTLGHNSLPSACSGVCHKGIVQSAPAGGRAMPETYGYVRTSRPRVSELSGSDP